MDSANSAVNMKQLFLPLLFIACAAVASPRLEIIESPYLHCSDTVAVYSPISRAMEKDLPTLFLLHGYSGSWRDWGNHTDLQSLCDRTGWRIICPDGFYKSWYFDDADPDKMQWRSFFWKECWPLMEEKYGLNPSRTFITGLSMGGHGAMTLFLDHPERFRGAGSMSGVLDLRYSSGSKDYIPIVLGRKSIEKCDDQSAVWRLEKYASAGPAVTDGKLLVITCGFSDRTFCPAARLFEDRCEALGIRHIAMYSEGYHRWEYWTYILPYHLGWFSEVMD